MQFLYLDLEKSALNTSKLVRKPVTVKGKNGKVFTRMQWVNPYDDSVVLHGRRAHENEPVQNKEPFHPIVSLEQKEHELSTEEVDKRMGRIGSLDLSRLTEGTPLADVMKKTSKECAKLMEGHPYTRGVQASPEGHVKSLFKDITKEGLEHVFSHPDGDYVAELTMIALQGSKETGHLVCSIGLDYLTKDGDFMGSTEREVHRDSTGHLYVWNELTQMDSQYQHQNIAETEQERSEQLWRHMSQGNPVHLSLSANISIGVYSWAVKGYDFDNAEDLQTAKTELFHFLEKNSMNPEEVLESCGYNSVNDLKHSWQFAMLDDGKKYQLSKLDIKGNEDLSKKLKGSIGKAFMLGGKSYWKGEKVLNASTDHEDISALHKKNSQKSKKRAAKTKKVVVKKDE